MTLQTDSTPSRPVALVTGAAGGIGQATCQALARDGYDLFLTDLNFEPNLTSHADRYKAAGCKAVDGLTADLTDPASAPETVRRAVDRLGRLDALVNCAGASMVSSFLTQDFDSWRTIRRINLDAAFLICQAGARKMIELGRPGAIVIVSSIAHLSGGANPAYGASKGGLVTMTYSMVQELGPKGITVNAVAPGVIETDMVRRAFPGSKLDDLRRNVGRRTPLKRLGAAEDVAELIAFLVSPRARFVTGAIIPITGGIELMPPLGQMAADG